jgi:hypothetical protein
VKDNARHKPVIDEDRQWLVQDARHRQAVTNERHRQAGASGVKDADKNWPVKDTDRQ